MELLRNSKVGTKLNILITISSIACIVLSLIGFWGLERGKSTSSNMYEDNLLPIEWIGIVESNFYHVNMNFMEIMLSKDEKRMNELIREMDGIRKENDHLLKQFEAKLISTKEKELYNTFHETFNELRTQMKKAQELGKSNNEEAYAYYLKEIEPNMQKSIKSIRELILYNSNNAELLQKENNNSAQNTMIMFVSISILAILIIILIGYVIKLTIRKPLALLQNDMEKVAAGDLTTRTPYKANNELGHIVQSFNSMLDNLQQLIANVKMTTQEVISTTEGVLQDTNRASSISNEVVQTVLEVKTKIEGQVTSIQESSSSMEEITTGVQTVAESSAVVAEVAVTTTERINIGSEVINHSILQMNSVHDVVEETSKVINKLVTRTQQIDTALAAITNIAEQTNLLALNAAIEAARAGENGKGFAVVAAEVRDLAEQSKESAKEVNHLIKSIQKDTQDTVNVMQKGQQKAVEGKEAAYKANQTFLSIMRDIDKITGQIQEVSAATEEMSAGTEEVNASLSLVSETATDVKKETLQTVNSIQSQAESIEQISIQSNKMKEKVEELTELVSKFNITEQKE
ncbi:methyl-accepting chemotaxis protein [Bacillus cereus]|uniref:Methyl-accepting chemotaxis protein n=1 Tax=Bacillus cereus TaxID=1396 RepID=A0A9X7CIJ3_BACCE|nr:MULTISPECIES: methyl-accepting chemotaxis protein [Bacillus cereus group]EOP94384.1 methyl-accepting chemotaxis protein [Bacillus cereus VD140]MBD8074523.1 methyl-accepting chemotaxis protein [Bacillus thuringiensis]MCH5474693.1 methyl-accepting chemotaxis protein [Bacillus cereus]MCU4859145.1 methyl-accepting chemotaxis protein [Bacillus cereus]MCU4979293.1 methyl-accepting chemotaxis protein [Bacillus cereus]